MLDLFQMQFVQERDEVLHKTRTIGGISLQASVTTDDRERVLRSSTRDIKSEIKYLIWDKVYGDLIKPLRELESVAMCGVLPQYQDELKKKMDTINSLLTLK